MSRSKTYDDVNTMDGKSKLWRDAADSLLYALAKENKYIVSDIVIIHLERAGLGLENYSAVGGVFRRAATKGYISRIDWPTKQALWVSNLYLGSSPETE